LSFLFSQYSYLLSLFVYMSNTDHCHKTPVPQIPTAHKIDGKVMCQSSDRHLFPPQPGRLRYPRAQCKNSFRKYQLSIFDANTLSKQFTWHIRLSHSPYSELASNSGNILTLPQTTATPIPMQTFLDLHGQAEYHTFQQ